MKDENIVKWVSVLAILVLLLWVFVTGYYFNETYICKSEKLLSKTIYCFDGCYNAERIIYGDNLTEPSDMYLKCADMCYKIYDWRL